MFEVSRFNRQPHWAGLLPRRKPSMNLSPQELLRTKQPQFLWNAIYVAFCHGPYLIILGDQIGDKVL